MEEILPKHFVEHILNKEECLNVISWIFFFAQFKQLLQTFERTKVKYCELGQRDLILLVSFMQQQPISTVR